MASGPAEWFDRLWAGSGAAWWGVVLGAVVGLPLWRARRLASRYAHPHELPIVLGFLGLLGVVSSAAIYGLGVLVSVGVGRL